jgi:2-polyprenyl-6-methoxyphenol hydroxylase-like FAD-dependent oxidoreductase
MKYDSPRILVIGAGVNGSVCAAHLRTAGVDVTVLARAHRLAPPEDDKALTSAPNMCR